MNKLIRFLYLTVSILFVSTVFTGAYLSDSAVVGGNTFSIEAQSQPSCQNFPGPDFCQGGIENIIISGYDENGCAIYVCAPLEEPQTNVVINEVYYDVDENHGDDGGSNSDEWIELFNNTDIDINLKDWSVSDNTNSRTISHANFNIPAKGFALMAKSANTWSYWSVPNGVQIISLGQNIGGGLSNSGDRLILRNATGEVVDQISYGTDNSITNPAILDVAEGHSISRSPNGKDTDTFLDFIDLINPTPGS